MAISNLRVAWIIAGCRCEIYFMDFDTKKALWIHKSQIHTNIQLINIHGNEMTTDDTWTLENNWRIKNPLSINSILLLLLSSANRFHFVEVYRFRSKFQNSKQWSEMQQSERGILHQMMVIYSVVIRRTTETDIFNMQLLSINDNGNIQIITFNVLNSFRLIITLNIECVGGLVGWLVDGYLKSISTAQFGMY